MFAAYRPRCLVLLVVSLASCSEPSGPPPSARSQSASLVNQVDVAWSATLTSVTAASLSVTRDGVIQPSYARTLATASANETFTGLAKGVWRFILTTAELPPDTTAVTVPDYAPTAVAAFWTSFNADIVDGATRSANLADAFTDANPEDRPVPITAATSVDGRTLVSLTGSMLEWTANAAPGSYQLQIGFGQPSGGTGSRNVTGNILAMPDIAVRVGGESVGRPGVASDGSLFFTAWLEGTTVKARRISATGAPLDGDGLTLGTSLGNPAFPTVGFDGSNFIAVWMNGEWQAARVSTGGAVLDATPVTLTTGAEPKQRAPGLAFDGSNYLLAWRTATDGIRSMRFTPALVPLDSAQGQMIGYGYYPWVSYGDGVFLVTWHRYNSNGWLNIRGNRVSASNGNALDGVGALAGFSIGGGGDHQQDHASNSFGNGQFLVTWTDRRHGFTGAGNSRAYGARVLPTGVVVDATGFEIAPMAISQSPVVNVWDGTQWAVFWQVDLTGTQANRRWDVLWRAVSSGGVPLGSVGDITSSNAIQGQPTAGASATRILVTWQEDNFARASGIYGQLRRK